MAKDKVADPIIVHADVRRMLLTMKASNEGGRAFSTYVANQLDIAKFSEDPAARERADGLVALLTPVAKAFLTDLGLETTVHGQQVFGGHGYIREWGQEQLVRDVRITQIYEGTNGIQALDLVGRKIVGNQGSYYRQFADEIRQFIATTSSMLAWVLEHAGMAPGFLIGGVPQNFAVSARLGDTPFFVVEADEYDSAFFDKRSKFVHYRPRTAILNNLEFDHADIFPDLPAIERQFHHLVRTIPSEGLVIHPTTEPALQRVIEMGCWTPVQTKWWNCRSIAGKSGKMSA